MRRQRRRSFHRGDAVLHRLLHLLEGTHAYLAHALARDAELVGELLERDRLFGSRRASKMRRSRSLSAESAEASALLRLLGRPLFFLLAKAHS